MTCNISAAGAVQVQMEQIIIIEKTFLKKL